MVVFWLRALTLCRMEQYKRDGIKLRNFRVVTKRVVLAGALTKGILMFYGRKMYLCYPIGNFSELLVRKPILFSYLF